MHLFGQGNNLFACTTLCRCSRPASLAQNFDPFNKRKRHDDAYRIKYKLSRLKSIKECFFRVVEDGKYGVV
jgi:hypothetical protein